MKLFRLLPQFLLGLVVASFVACTTPPTLGADGKPVATSPAQQAVNSLNTSYTALNAAILSASGAVDSGVLKGQDARNARAAFTTAKQGLDAALAALKNAQAAAAASAAASAPK